MLWFYSCINFTLKIWRALFYEFKPCDISFFHIKLRHFHNFYTAGKKELFIQALVVLHFLHLTDNCNGHLLNFIKFKTPHLFIMKWLMLMLISLTRFTYATYLNWYQYHSYKEGFQKKYIYIFYYLNKVGWKKIH